MELSIVLFVAVASLLQSCLERHLHALLLLPALLLALLLLPAPLVASLLMQAQTGSLLRGACCVKPQDERAGAKLAERKDGCLNISISNMYVLTTWRNYRS